ncbi:hypothetical protein DENIS_5124 [Desulfonema ishimotonii]|uniref:Bulb-type lectin domain-containing protein n=1 Tax=Desulfonema ishimotonii TaxID=45657 RepID=A0A401G4D9_9BACT|nr:hypothetical protein [Desulfonema ishimotonii]GBC64107.1 hypothetical protein DENIS_5124 [Desulfonema ishimotonii]
MKIKFAKHQLMVLILSLVFPFAAHAGDPAGWWTSNSGSKVHIWANMQQLVITIQPAGGQQYKYQGWWTRFSDNFSYQVPGLGNHTCGFASNNSNVIYVRAPNGGIYTWTRGIQNTVKKKSAGISGTWRSSTGSTIQLTGNNKQVFLTFITANGARLQAAGRWLSGYKFDYSVAGYAGVAECTVDQNNWNIIYCSYKGKWSTWNKIQ